VALRRLLASADLGSALGSAARKAAEERFSSETLVKRTTALYRALLAPR
jgi:glycosyltransferase involved in cell wall biosynthesis